ncbi:hypothetical protein BH18THE1_BH18THE1_14920 [soil metagenome]
MKIHDLDRLYMHFKKTFPIVHSPSISITKGIFSKVQRKVYAGYIIVYNKYGYCKNNDVVDEGYK